MARRTPAIRGPFLPTLLVVVAATALATTGADVVDTVNVEVDARDTVSGTLRPAQERETYLIDLPRGAILKVTAKGTSKGGPAPVMDVLDPDLNVIAQSPAGKPTKVPSILTTMSGLYRVRVCGDGDLDGDFELKVRAKLPKSAAEKAAAELAPEAERSIVFGASEGAVAKITLSRSGKSGFAAQILEITGPDAFSLAIDPPVEPGSRHTVRDVLLPSAGDYSVRFKNAGTGAGQWKAKVKLGTAKTRKRALDLSDEALAGEFAGEQAVFARSVDERGGIVSPPEGHDLLGGVSIDVPTGAITEPTLILIHESEPFFVEDDVNEGGPTFEFGPDGLEFDEPALVTLPYDAQFYDDPETEVMVALRDSRTGEVELVPGTIDTNAGTITFATRHFSQFQPASPRPRPLRGGFVELELNGRLDPGFASSVRFGLNAVRGAPGPRTGNAVTRELDRFEVRVAPQPNRGGIIEGIRDQRTQTGTITAGETIDLDLGGNTASFQRGRSPDIFLRRDLVADRGTISVLLRRVKGKPTRGALVGDWNAMVLEYSAIRGPDGVVALSSVGQVFQLTVDAKGKAVATKTFRSVTSTPLLQGNSRTQTDKKRPVNGTLRPNGSTALLDMEIGHRTVVDTVDLHPVVRGDALVGVTGAVLGDPNDPTMLVTRLVILTRSGSGGSEAALDGRSRFAGFDLALVPSGSASPVAGARFDVLALDVEHDGAGRLRARGFGSTFSRAATGGVVRDDRQLDFNSTYAVAKNLSYTEKAPFDGGVVLIRRGLYISTLFSGDRVAIGFGLPARPLDD